MQEILLTVGLCPSLLAEAAAEAASVHRTSTPCRHMAQNRCIKSCAAGQGPGAMDSHVAVGSPQELSMDDSPES